MLVRSSDKIIPTKIQNFFHFFEIFSLLIDVILHIYFKLPGFAKKFQTVLIGSGVEKNFSTKIAIETRQNVGFNNFHCKTNVRMRIHIRQSCRDVKFFFSHIISKS